MEMDIAYVLQFRLPRIKAVRESIYPASASIPAPFLFFCFARVRNSSGNPTNLHVDAGERSISTFIAS